jgi:hypothetical protein
MLASRFKKVPGRTISMFKQGYESHRANPTVLGRNYELRLEQHIHFSFDCVSFVSPTLECDVLHLR